MSTQGTKAQPEPAPAELQEMVRDTPPSGPKRPLGLLAMVATFGSLLFGYDTGVISGALPFMYMPAKAGGLYLTSSEEGLVGGLLAIGAAFGAIIGGRLSDRYGRRTNITLLAVIFVVGTLGCVVSPNVWVLYPFRFILGWAVGGASATVPIYLAENAPSRIRGPIVAIDQFMIVFGQLLAYSLNAVISSAHGGPQVQIASDPSGTFTPGDWYSWDAVSKVAGVIVEGGNGQAWRWMLVLATIPAIALWIGIRLMPESCRWYISQGRYRDAIGALKRIRREGDDVETEVEQMVDATRCETDQEKWTFRQIWDTKWTRKILIIGIFLGFFDQLTGINTAMYYLPKILNAAGFSSADAITLNVVTGLTSAIGAAIGLFLVGRFMRRHVGMYQEGGITICLTTLALVFGFGIAPHMDANGNLGSSIPAFLPWLVLIVVAIFVFVKQSGTVNWVLVSEIFPSRMRGVGQGIAVGCLWLMNAVVTWAFPVMMAHLGATITYGIFAAINFVAFLFYWKIVPETKNHTLEELEPIFEEKYS